MALPEVKAVAVPVVFVRSPEAGVPNAGVMNVGEVKVPLLTVGLVNVLLLKVSAPVRVARVPAVGNVTFVAPVDVKVTEFAPAVSSVEPTPRVNVPLPGLIVLPLIVLLVKASAPASVAKVPELGSVTIASAATA